MRVPRKLAIAAAFVLAASMWYYVIGLLIPYQKAEAAQSGRPRGNLSDLYPRWIGSRELLLHGRDPYSPEVTREIQRGYYGRALDRAHPNHPRDEQRFAYPVFVALYLAPFVRMPYETVRHLFTLICAASALFSVFAFMRFVDERSPSLRILTVVLASGSFPFVQAVLLQQLSLPVIALVAAALLAIQRTRYALAGVLLGLCTIKPQMIALLVACLFGWSLGAWRTRQWMTWSFTATCIALAGVGEWLLRGWLLKFIAALRDYLQYTGTSPAWHEMVGAPAGRVLGALTVAACIALAWKFRRFSADDERFRLMIAFVLLATLFLAPYPYNQLMVLPALLLLARWRTATPVQLFARAIAFALIGWQWVATVSLAIAAAIASPERARDGWVLPLIAIIFLPLGAFGALSLYIRQRLVAAPDAATEVTIP